LGTLFEWTLEAVKEIKAKFKVGAPKGEKDQKVSGLFQQETSGLSQSITFQRLGI